MKKLLKPYLINLIKSNVVYLISLVILIILISLLSIYGINNIRSLNTKIADTTIENQKLEKRLNLLNTAIESPTELDDSIKFLNSLVPNAEDYFSIIYSLEKLSQKTGFIIVAYNVNMTTTKKGELKMSVSGVGDTVAFMNFLENYNFGGNRLITSDSISLSPDLPDAIKINLTFYTKKVSTSLTTDFNINKKIFEDLASLKKKINFTYDENTIDESTMMINYEKKTNLFE